MLSPRFQVFLDAKTVAGRSPKTIEFYAMALRRFEAHLAGRPITDAEVVSFLASIRGATGTRAAYGRAVRAWARWSKVDLTVDWPKPPRPTPDALSSAEVAALLGACFCVRDRVLTILLTEVGLRRSELLALNWPDVDFDRHRLTIRVSKTGPRHAPLPRRSAEALQLIRRPDGPVFRTYRGRLTAAGLRQVFRRLSARTGIPVTPHKFRRTAATRLANGGASAVVLCAAMGWASLSVANHYIVPDFSAVVRIQDAAWAA